ncbi:MAG: hypothetical protein IAC78_02845 [Firmicutes bacterium]|uniref:Uncharacterized protein n=1 Tax=Candidatus Scatoplasma merdavium TaxID=2840932 RepID=A0A9D9GR78_9BACL|nr:hypothetical protein [Candidatus Scatoplasma merdavium]
MNKLIDILKKAIFPSYLYIAVCILVALGFLNYSLLSPDPFVWIIYLGYAVYAYTFLLIVLKIPSIIKKYKELKKTNKYLMKYFSDPNLRVKISLIGTFSINIAFGFFQLCLAIFYSSVWFYTLSFYYFVLIAVRGIILRKISKSNEESLSLKTEYKYYLFCGSCLLILTSVLFGISFMFLNHQEEYYTGDTIVIISSALFTFVTLTISIIGLIRYKKFNSPLLNSAKILSFISAIVSLLFLEASMLSAFGDSAQEEQYWKVNSISGFVVSVLVLSISIYIIVKSLYSIRRISQDSSLNNFK